MNNYNYYDPQTEAYRYAERRVKAKLGFFWHLASYVVVNGFLITIYLVTSWDNNGFAFYYPWFIWPLFGWGVGLVFNFLAVFVFQDDLVSRQRLIEKELHKMGMGDNQIYTSQPQPMAQYPVYPSIPGPAPASSPVATPSQTETDAPVHSEKIPVG